uniref:LEA n=1 Tax=Sanionia uncinata TaxID=140003 RepID=A0A346PYD7_9BRYO|nr:LEA [Sanionia uncinata]
MADFDGAKNKAHEDAENILKSADKKADEALDGLDTQGIKDDGADAQAAPTVGEKASDATEKTKESTGQAWESTKQGTSDATEKTKESTGQAWESTKQGTSDAAEKTKAGTGQAWESTKQGTSDAAEATKEKAGQAKDETASLLQKGGEKVQGVVAKAYDALDKANRYETYQSKE